MGLPDAHSRAVRVATLLLATAANACPTACADLARRVTGNVSCDVASYPYDWGNKICYGILPACVLRPSDAGDVAAAVAASREHAVPLSYRSGGHSYTCAARVRSRGSRGGVAGVAAATRRARGQVQRHQGGLDPPRSPVDGRRDRGRRRRDVRARRGHETAHRRDARRPHDDPRPVPDGRRGRSLPAPAERN